MTGQLTGATATTVASAMTRHPFAVSPHTPFKHVLELLADRAIGAVPVVSATGIVVGEVSDADLLRHRNGRAARRHGAGRLTAGELMTSPVVTVPPTTPLARAERMLAGRTRLYVVDDGRLVGVLSRRDVLTVLRRLDKEIQAEIEQRIVEPVGLSVHDGIVQLTGRLPHRADIDAALAVVAGTPGVIDVRNRVVAEHDDRRR
jgi:CBS domain-containing protein